MSYLLLVLCVGETNYNTFFSPSEFYTFYGFVFLLQNNEKVTVLGIEPSPSHMHTNSSNQLQLCSWPRLRRINIYIPFSASPLHLIFYPAGSLSHSTSKPVAPPSAPSQSSTLPPPLSISGYSSSSLGSLLRAGPKGRWVCGRDSPPKSGAPWYVL
jgi:hypothetical protein